MVPQAIIEKEKPKKEVEIKGTGRNISPYVANLIITRLKDISEAWWAEINVLLHSTSALDRKFAVTEINKIQLKAMPNQIAADEGININVNVVKYGDADNNPLQLPAQVIPGTIIEGDG